MCQARHILKCKSCMFYRYIPDKASPKPSYFQTSLDLTTFYKTTPDLLPTLLRKIYLFYFHCNYFLVYLSH